jgi:hypothetical protein
MRSALGNRVTLARWEPQSAIGLALGLLSFGVYAWLGPAQQNTSSFVPLAEAFLHGRDYLTAPMPWDELALRAAGGFYVPFPPFPALALVPFVAMLGVGQVDTNWTTALFAGLAVWQTFGLLRDLRLGVRDALVLTVGLGLGSEFLYVAATGGHHYLPEVIAALGLTAALRLGLRGRRPWLAGIWLACAIASRPPVAFTLPFFVYLYGRDLGPWHPVDLVRPEARRLARLIGRWASLAVPLAVAAILLGLYNAARFGSPFDFGYAVIIGGNDQLIRCASGCHYPTTESWFAQGIESVTYIPRSLHYMLASGFKIVRTFPYLKPSWNGLSILVMMPSLLWIARAPWRERLVQVAGLALVLGLLPDLAHGSWGFAQVGYRFFLDVLPIAWLLVGLAVARHGLGRFLFAALCVGAIVTWYCTVASWVGFISY